MCNLYNLKVTRWELNDYFRSTDDWRNQLAVDKDYAAPGKPGLVVRLDGGARVLSSMIWGFPTRRPRKRAPKEGQPPFLIDWWTNARNLEKSMWSKVVAAPANRCLVPFTSFAEPKAAAARTGPGDTSWWFSLADAPIAAFAGIWKEDPELGRVYSFLTCDPNPLVAPVHPKAMPVILLPEDYDRWLTVDAGEALAMQAAFPSQMMRMD